MKTILLAFAATTISAVASINNAKAQPAMSNSTNNSQVYAYNSPELKSTNSGSSVNLKAMKDFKKSFAAINDENWEVIKDGYVAQFSQNGTETTVGYDKKGNHIFDLLRYDESKLPRDVRAEVKSTYYDYTITIVEEIHYADQTVYLVHMQDANTWKIIRVSDAGMDVYQDFQKAQ